MLAWLQPTRPDRFQPAAFPVFNLEVEEGRFYGFPSFLMPGFKFGKYHHRGENVDPDTVNREPEPEDEELLRAFARRYFPEGEGPTLMLKACMFTNTPDRHFILDRHPAHPEVVDRGRVLGARLQVLQRGRGGDGGSGAGGAVAARHRVLPAGTLRRVELSRLPSGCCWSTRGRTGRAGMNATQWTLIFRSLPGSTSLITRATG